MERLLILKALIDGKSALWSLLANEVKNKNYHTVGTVPNSIIKVVKRGKIGTPNTQICDIHFPGLAHILQ